MAKSIIASRIEGIDADNLDYIIDLKIFSRTEADNLTTETGGLNVVLKVDGIQWATGTANEIGGRAVNVDNYRQRLKDLHYSGSGITRPTVDRHEQFIYMLNTAGNGVRKYTDVTGSFTQKLLFNTFSGQGGNADQGGASNGYDVVWLHFNSTGLPTAHNFKKRRVDIDVGDIYLDTNIANTGYANGGMANNFNEYVVFGRGGTGTLCEKARFDDRGTVVTMPATTHTGTNGNRGGANSHDGHEWYDMYANAAFSLRKIDCYTFDSATTATRHTASFRLQQGSVYAPQGNSFGTELATGRNTEMEIWNMETKASKTVVSGAFGSGTQPTQTWRGDRDNTMICFGNNPNVGIINFSAQTQSTASPSTLSGASGPMVQGGY